MSLIRSQGKGHRLEMFRQLTPINTMLPQLQHSRAWVDELGHVRCRSPQVGGIDNRKRV